MDIKNLIGEIAARHQLRVEPDDPIFVLVTANELILREAMERFDRQLRTAMTDFVGAAEKLEAETGTTLATQLSKALGQARQSFRNDITAANAQLRETVRKQQSAQTRPYVIMWCAIGLLSGALLFLCGVIV